MCYQGSNINNCKKIHIQISDRYRTNGTGQICSGCNKNDTFIICEGFWDCRLFLFNSYKIPLTKAEKYLEEQGYGLRIAKGLLKANVWKFTEPTDPTNCKKLLHRIVTDDPDILRYYLKWQAIAPNGKILGTMDNFIGYN